MVRLGFEEGLYLKQARVQAKHTAFGVDTSMNRGAVMQCQERGSP